MTNVYLMHPSSCLSLVWVSWVSPQPENAIPVLWGQGRLPVTLKLCDGSQSPFPKPGVGVGEARQK